MLMLLQSFCFSRRKCMIWLVMIIGLLFWNQLKNGFRQFLNALLCYLGDSVSYGTTSSGLTPPLACCPSSSFSRVVTPSEGIVRWKLRLEYFAYEILQDLRIAKLFEIIVDYPESSSAIEDLKQGLEYTGQHSKLVESFISSLKCRLLTAGALTNDILHQYVSTIKAFRAIDPAGVFLEAVESQSETIYGAGKMPFKCTVTMLTDGSEENANGSGNPGIVKKVKEMLGLMMIFTLMISKPGLTLLVGNRTMSRLIL